MILHCSLDDNSKCADSEFFLNVLFVYEDILQYAKDQDFTLFFYIELVVCWC